MEPPFPEIKPLPDRLKLESPRSCPHCRVSISPRQMEAYIGRDDRGGWGITYFNCPNPECRRLVVEFLNGTPLTNSSGFHGMGSDSAVQPALPRTPASRPIPAEIVDPYRREYEAAAIIADSPEASAALSRRCLQRLLIDRYGVKKRDLYDQIEEVMASNQLPPRIADELHGVRVIGNFGAHPLKSTSTGDFMDVEPGEAEWNLDALGSLLDHTFVEPARRQRRKDDLNAKLAEAGKPPLK